MRARAHPHTHAQPSSAWTATVTVADGAVAVTVTLAAVTQRDTRTTRDRGEPIPAAAVACGPPRIRKLAPEVERLEQRHEVQRLGHRLDALNAQLVPPAHRVKDGEGRRQK